ncbi:MAG: type IV pilus assembly protein PilM [bacterium]|nr:type IV pilus assembly protein PilM [bacterium]
MISIKGVGDFFSLDIGTNSVRAVQLSQSKDGTWGLVGLGYVNVEPQLILSESEESRKKLGSIISTMIGQSDIKTKNVAIGLSSQKTFTTIVDMPNQDPKELERTVKYQIDQFIPMSVDDAKFDWAILGQSPKDESLQEVLIASTAKSYSEERLEFIENLGFNVIAAEPDSLSMSRALALPDAVPQLIVDFGENSTDISIVAGGNPRLVRTIPVGLHALVKSATQNLNIKEDQAEQFILKFGLAKDKLEGQVFRAIETTLENFAQEITKSAKFFSNKYPGSQIGVIVLSGFAGSIPQFGEYIASKVGVQTVSGNPFQNVKIPAKFNQLVQDHGSEFAVAMGLAKRSVK